MTSPDYLVLKKELQSELRLSETTIWRMMNDGRLPTPVRIGRRVGWPRSVIESWKVEQGWPAPAPQTTTEQG